MRKHRAFHQPFWLALAAALCAAGMWTYANRVLIPYQHADAALRGTPRGNLSDLYPRWLGARELLLHGRDPYSPEVTREIQAGYYGRPLDSTRSQDPKDKQGFAYPVYVVFYLAPTIHLPFEVVRRGFFWVLLFLTAVSIHLWLRVLRWSGPPWTEIVALALTLGSFPVMQGLQLQQMSLLVAAIIATAMAVLSSGYPVAAGILLALAAMKPQLLVLLLAWLGLWSLADWRRRYRWAVSFLATMALLMAASEWYLPRWIPRFYQAVRDYQGYTGAMPAMEKLLHPAGGRFLEFLAFAALLWACWRQRRAAANSDAFGFTLGLVLATTVLLVPTYAPYNQVLLTPALLVLVKERRAIWQRSAAHRVLFAITIGLIVWPWVSSTTLACLSFVMPPETVERAWAIPFWTALALPVGVAALILARAYQRAFAAPTGPKPA